MTGRRLHCLPFQDQAVYINVSNRRVAKNLEDDFQILGAKIESCFSKEVTLVVCDNGAQDGLQGSRSVPSPAGAGQSPHAYSPYMHYTRGSVNSPLSPATSTNINQLSRAAKMLSNANLSKHHGTSDIIALAKRWKIRVENCFKMQTRIDKELQEIPSELRYRSGKKGAKPQDRIKPLPSNFFKFEDDSLHYCPAYYDIVHWPKLYCLTPGQDCPFQRPKAESCRARMEEGIERADQLEVKDTQNSKFKLRTGSVVNLPAKSCTKSAHTFRNAPQGYKGKGKKGSKSGNGGKPIVPAVMTQNISGSKKGAVLDTKRYTTEELRQIIAEKRKKRSGFCEMCKIHFEDLEKHRISETHRNFLRKAENFARLDAWIKSGPNMDQFLTDVMTYQQQHMKEGLAESEMEDEVIMIKESVPQHLRKPRISDLASNTPKRSFSWKDNLPGPGKDVRPLGEKYLEPTLKRKPQTKTPSPATKTMASPKSRLNPPPKLFPKTPPPPVPSPTRKSHRIASLSSPKEKAVHEHELCESEKVRGQDEMDHKVKCQGATDTKDTNQDKIDQEGIDSMVLDNETKQIMHLVNHATAGSANENQKSTAITTPRKSTRRSISDERLISPVKCTHSDTDKNIDDTCDSVSGTPRKNRQISSPGENATGMELKRRVVNRRATSGSSQPQRRSSQEYTQDLDEQQMTPSKRQCLQKTDFQTPKQTLMDHLDNDMSPVIPKISIVRLPSRNCSSKAKRKVEMDDNETNLGSPDKRIRFADDMKAKMADAVIENTCDSSTPGNKGIVTPRRQSPRGKDLALSTPNKRRHSPRILRTSNHETCHNWETKIMSPVIPKNSIVRLPSRNCSSKAKRKVEMDDNETNLGSPDKRIRFADDVKANMADAVIENTCDSSTPGNKGIVTPRRQSPRERDSALSTPNKRRHSPRILRTPNQETYHNWETKESIVSPVSHNAKQSPITVLSQSSKNHNSPTGMSLRRTPRKQKLTPKTNTPSAREILPDSPQKCAKNLRSFSESTNSVSSKLTSNEGIQQSPKDVAKKARNIDSCSAIHTPRSSKKNILKERSKAETIGSRNELQTPKRTLRNNSVSTTPQNNIDPTIEKDNSGKKSKSSSPMSDLSQERLDKATFALKDMDWSNIVFDSRRNSPLRRPSNSSSKQENENNETKRKSKASSKGKIRGGANGNEDNAIENICSTMIGSFWSRDEESDDEAPPTLLPVSNQIQDQPPILKHISNENITVQYNSPPQLNFVDRETFHLDTDESKTSLPNLITPCSISHGLLEKIKESERNVYENKGNVRDTPPTLKRKRKSVQHISQSSPLKVSDRNDIASKRLLNVQVELCRHSVEEYTSCPYMALKCPHRIKKQSSQINGSELSHSQTSNSVKTADNIETAYLMKSSNIQCIELDPPMNPKDQSVSSLKAGKIEEKSAAKLNRLMKEDLEMPVLKKQKFRKKLEPPVKVLTDRSVTKLLDSDSEESSDFEGFESSDSVYTDSDLSYCDVTEIDLTELSDYELVFEDAIGCDSVFSKSTPHEIKIQPSNQTGDFAYSNFDVNREDIDKIYTPKEMIFNDDAMHVNESKADPLLEDVLNRLNNDEFISSPLKSLDFLPPSAVMLRSPSSSALLPVTVSRDVFIDPENGPLRCSSPCEHNKSKDSRFTLDSNRDLLYYDENAGLNPDVAPSRLSDRSQTRGEKRSPRKHSRSLILKDTGNFPGFMSAQSDYYTNSSQTNCANSRPLNSTPMRRSPRKRNYSLPAPFGSIESNLNHSFGHGALGSNAQNHRNNSLDSSLNYSTQSTFGDTEDMSCVTDSSLKECGLFVSTSFSEKNDDNVSQNLAKIANRTEPIVEETRLIGDVEQHLPCIKQLSKMQRQKQMFENSEKMNNSCINILNDEQDDTQYLSNSMVLSPEIPFIGLPGKSDYSLRSIPYSKIETNVSSMNDISNEENNPFGHLPQSSPQKAAIKKTNNTKRKRLTDTSHTLKKTKNVSRVFPKKNRLKRSHPFFNAKRRYPRRSNTPLSNLLEFNNNNIEPSDKQPVRSASLGKVDIAKYVAPAMVKTSLEQTNAQNSGTDSVFSSPVENNAVGHKEKHSSMHCMDKKKIVSLLISQVRRKSKGCLCYEHSLQSKCPQAKN